MTFAATLLLSALPQVFPGGDLKLPPKPPDQQQAAEAVVPLSELERFRRDLVALRGSDGRFEVRLEELGRSYTRIEPLILDVARTARAHEMTLLMPVARRYGRAADGSSKVGDELLFQLLVRPLGDATAAVVQAMVELKGPAARDALRQCVEGRIPGVRRHAVDALVPLLTPADAEWALQLTQSQALDLQLRGVELLTALGDPGSLTRLVALLSKEPAVAAAACAGLIRSGERAAPTLLQHVATPAIDRSFAYAAFALAEVERQRGEPLLPAELFAPLEARLAAPEPLDRCLAAVPLADLVHRSSERVRRETDVALVETLLAVVEPTSFVPNLDLLREPAERRLVRHTGRVTAQAETLRWRDWWRTQKDSFRGVRERVAVDASNCGAVVVTLRQEQRQVRVLG